MYRLRFARLVSLPRAPPPLAPVGLGTAAPARIGGALARALIPLYTTQSTPLHAQLTVERVAETAVHS